MSDGDFLPLQASRPSGSTPLMMACGDDRCGVGLVETLLDYEADPATKDRSGRTAME